MLRSPLTAAILLTMTCQAAGQSSPAAAPLTLDDLFPSDRVLDVQITLAKQDWKKLRLQSRTFTAALGSHRKEGKFKKPYTYVEADVVIDGVEFGKVGVRKKGFIGSQSTTRPSLKIALDHTDANGGIEGLTNLTLNNNQQDPSQCYQVMAYRLFNAAGSPAPRCALARVTVNGAYLGVYSHVETVRQTVLDRGFGSSAGTLYEGTVVDFFEGWAAGFERKLGKDGPGRERIERLIETLADTENPDMEQAIGELVDLESFYTFWAIEGLIGFWDGYSSNQNNYFIYLHPDTQRFHFLPWGADALFVKNSPMFRRRGAPISVKTTGMIAHRLYQLESGRQRYKAAMERLLEDVWNEKALLAQLDRIEALIEPHLGRTQRRALDGLDDSRDFIEERRGDIVAEIEGGMPIWKRAPRRPFSMGDRGRGKERR